MMSSSKPLFRSRVSAYVFALALLGLSLARGVCTRGGDKPSVIQGIAYPGVGVWQPAVRMAAASR